MPTHRGQTPQGPVFGGEGGVERPCLHTGARHRDQCLGVRVGWRGHAYTPGPDTGAMTMFGGEGGVERPCLHTGARHRGHDPCLGVRVGWRGHACTPGPDTGAMTRVWG